MSFYDATVPAFLQILGSLSGLLTKAEAHCEAKKIQPEVLLSARLYPDMLPLTKQIQIASDFAAKSCARLTGSEVPTTPDTEKTFEELRQRLAKTVDPELLFPRRDRPRHPAPQWRRNRQARFSRGGLIFSLSPLFRRSFAGESWVRGSHQEFSSWRVPLTRNSLSANFDLSPQAGAR
jgi:Domain of unknown function (DUF1993)